MNLTLVIVTDGRWGYLRDSLASAKVNLPRFNRVVLVDDSAPELIPTDCLDAAAELGPLLHIMHDERRGLAAAVDSGFRNVGDCEAFWWHEDDFLYPAPVPIEDMYRALIRWPELAQVALLRQPWSPEEQQAGSIYATDPDAYTNRGGLMWHTKLFTLNPSLIPRIVADYGGGLEAEVTETLKDKGYKFAYYGNRGDGPRCWHIGTTRSPAYRW